MGCDVALLMLSEPIAVPPVAHPVAEDSGPHSENARLPLQVLTPDTVTVAVSVTWTEPVPIETLAAVGVVCTVVTHSPKLPRMKSFSVAVGDVDARVSDATDAKHKPLRPRPDRLTPPSKNSPIL